MEYQPINCSFYDELEARATLRRLCQITYRDESGGLQRAEGVIQDFFIREKAEYLLLSTGQAIRLDRLIVVDGLPVPRAC
ncbi:hypothetical protein [Phaeodactylibacter luteus]|uniref:Rho-binding antiterminator n=1 Tax=Phaeodactylibacter luteus TaxID=1564516 RepID=A0A5C6RPC9_9BACT|nr:hypothetical protein [Phaeodactylibacter luteus]TXB63242.1 hypothetical protein FRY97_09665 [Phaeodactylibacter luteus]